MTGEKQNNLSLRTIIISILVVFLFLTAASTILILFLAQYYPPDQNTLPQVTIIAYDTPTAGLTEIEMSQIPTVTENPVLHKFSRGLKVRIHGTGGDGLRIHQEAAQNSPTVYLAKERELFSIEDGPIFAGGYIWWKIKSFSNEKFSGWAAEDFLQIAINSP